MNIIVTGGGGFIGQNLCKKLLENSGNTLLCIDNFSTGDPEVINELVHHDGHDRLHVLRCDIEGNINEHNQAKRMNEHTIEVFGKEGVDEIYHLACPASPVAYQSDPIKTMMTSVVGTKNMLDIATFHDAKILFTSTSEIYGDPQREIQDEDYRGNVNCIGPRACYDEGKRAAESLCFDYNRTHKTKIKVVRIFNTYGPGMQPDDGRVVSNFIIQALQGRDFTIYGDGKQTRSFCFVDDMVDGLMSMMASSSTITGPINLGNPREITVKKLATMILDIVSTTTKMIYCDLPADDPQRRKPDISQARTLLAWHPLCSLERGLAYTIDYFKTKVGDNKS